MSKNSKQYAEDIKKLILYVLIFTIILLLSISYVRFNYNIWRIIFSVSIPILIMSIGQIRELK